MAWFLFINDADNSLDNLGNWHSSNDSGMDGGAADALPLPADDVWFVDTAIVDSGSLTANSLQLLGGSTLNGGTFTIATEVDFTSPVSINGGEFTIPTIVFNANSVLITSGLFHANIGVNNGGGLNVFGGGFYGDFQINDAVTNAFAPTFIQGTFFNVATPPTPIYAGAISGRMTFDTFSYFYGAGAGALTISPGMKG